MNTVALDLMVIVPLVAAALIAVAPGRLARAIALLSALSQVALAVLLLAQVGSDMGSPVRGAIETGIFSLRAGGVSLALLALNALVGCIAVSASWRIEQRPSAHFALLVFIQAAVACVFSASDILLFYIAWEAILIPMFLLISGWGSSGAKRAAMKYLAFSFAGGASLLVGLVMTILARQSTSIDALVAGGPESSVAFWLIAAGFLLKLPALPLHTWLPDAHTEAPSAGSIVLAGTLLKLGGFGLITIALPLYPASFAAASGVLAAAGIAGIVWGATAALVQTDLKRLVAYSSVSHMGFVLLAIATATPRAIAASVVAMVSHGLIAGLLFYLVGALYARTHTREMSAFGDLGHAAPRWGAALVFGALASAGLPGLSGFPGEYVTIIEAFGHLRWWALVPAVGVVLAAAYNVRMVGGTVQGARGEASDVPDLDARETLTALGIGLAVIALGIAPWLVSDLVAPVARSLAELVGRGA